MSFGLVNPTCTKPLTFQTTKKKHRNPTNNNTAWQNPLSHGDASGDIVPDVQHCMHCSCTHCTHAGKAVRSTELLRTTTSTALAPPPPPPPPGPRSLQRKRRAQHRCASGWPDEVGGPLGLFSRRNCSPSKHTMHFKISRSTISQTPISPSPSLSLSLSLPSLASTHALP